MISSQRTSCVAGLVILFGAILLCRSTSRAQSEALVEEELPHPVAIVVEKKLVAEPGGPPVQLNLLQDGAYYWARILLRPSAKSERMDWKIEVLDSNSRRLYSIPAAELYDAEDHLHSFWTPPISAPTVRIVVQRNGVPVKVESIVRGVDTVKVESTIGVAKLRPIDSSEPAAQRAKGVFLLEFALRSVKRCNAFLIAPSIVITNNHCVSSEEVITHNYYPRVYTDFRSNLNPGPEIAIAEILYTDVALDLTLLRLSEGVENAAMKVLAISEADPEPELPLQLIQHYKPMTWSRVISDDLDCRVLKIPVDGRNDRPGLDFFHGCDTEKGSSGAALISAATGEVVGLHHYGKVKGRWNFNKAVRIFLVASKLHELETKDPSRYSGFKFVNRR